MSKIESTTLANDVMESEEKTRNIKFAQIWTLITFLFINLI